MSDEEVDVGSEEVGEEPQEGSEGEADGSGVGSGAASGADSNADANADDVVASGGGSQNEGSDNGGAQSGGGGSGSGGGSRRESGSGSGSEGGSRRRGRDNSPPRPGESKRARKKRHRREREQGLRDNAGGASRKPSTNSVALYKNKNGTGKRGITVIDKDRSKKVDVEKDDFQRMTLHGPPTEDTDEYTEAVAAAKASGEPFVDPDFGGDSALGDTSKAGDKAQGNAGDKFAGVTWKRASSLPSAPLKRYKATVELDSDDPDLWEQQTDEDGNIFYHNIETKENSNDPPEGWVEPSEMYDVSLFRDLDAGDIRQGSLGDCWFLGALASIADRGGIQALFMGEQDGELSPEGVYGVWLWLNGEWHGVVVDDFIPVKGVSTVMARLTDTNEAWVIILEKAFAKLHGSYASICAGQAAEAMLNLTGGPSEMIKFKDYEKNPIEYFNRIRNTLLLKYSACAASASMHHLFSVLNAVELKIKGELVQLIEIRNPWGKGDNKYTGPWADTDEDSWNQTIGKKTVAEYLDYDPSKNDGEYWMPLDEFCKDFQKLHVCRSFMKSEWTMHELKGSTEDTATIPFTVKAKGSLQVSVCVTREDWRGRGLKHAKSYKVTVKDTKGKLIAKGNALTPMMLDMDLKSGDFLIGIDVNEVLDECAYYIRIFSYGDSGEIVCESELDTDAEYDLPDEDVDQEPIFTVEGKEVPISNVVSRGVHPPGQTQSETDSDFGEEMAGDMSSLWSSDLSSTTDDGAKKKAIRPSAAAKVSKGKGKGKASAKGKASGKASGKSKASGKGKRSASAKGKSSSAKASGTRAAGSKGGKATKRK